jgi:hypothetical protein
MQDTLGASAPFFMTEKPTINRYDCIHPEFVLP